MLKGLQMQCEQAESSADAVTKGSFDMSVALTPRPSRILAALSVKAVQLKSLGSQAMWRSASDGLFS
jgi:hypothetical protein